MTISVPSLPTTVLYAVHYVGERDIYHNYQSLSFTDRYTQTVTADYVYSQYLVGTWDYIVDIKSPVTLSSAPDRVVASRCNP